MNEEGRPKQQRDKRRMKYQIRMHRITNGVERITVPRKAHFVNECDKTQST